MPEKRHMVVKMGMMPLRRRRTSRTESRMPGAVIATGTMPVTRSGMVRTMTRDSVPGTVIVVAGLRRTVVAWLVIPRTIIARAVISRTIIVTWTVMAIPSTWFQRAVTRSVRPVIPISSRTPASPMTVVAGTRCPVRVIRTAT